METREELQRIIADATAKLERLDKESTLWVPEVGGRYFWVNTTGFIDSTERFLPSDNVHALIAKQGSIARTEEQAQWIADFRRITVPKCRVPEVGQTVYCLTIHGDALEFQWGDTTSAFNALNTGRIKLTPWTEEEVAEYKRIMTTNTNWRFTDLDKTTLKIG